MPFELVRQAAAEVADQPAVITAERSVTYGELLAGSDAIARGLHARGIERFGCSLENPCDAVTVMAGSAAAGAEACLYPRDLGSASLGEIAARFDHEVVIVDERRPDDDVPTLALSELASADGHEPSRPERAPVLILTTGTTGAQKGARHDWSRLIAAVRTPDPAPGKRWLLAYNLNQFAGIQIMLHVLASAATLVAPPTRRADDVIATIGEHGVTHVSATPTFWRLIVGRLSVVGRAGAGPALPLEQITLGGEATPEGLIEKLRELFPLARISHVYAGTEFGSVVSVTDGRSGMPLSVLDRGEDAPAQLRIVDGELQIRSRIGMLGYHETGDNDADWRPTGDLVEVRDGRIQFVGRTSEIINVGGAKIHPLPVEELVCSVPGVQLAAVYGRPNPVTGQIVAMDVVAQPGVDTKELEAQIRSKTQELPAAGRPRRIRFVDELEIKGNKLMRREAGAPA